MLASTQNVVTLHKKISLLSRAEWPRQRLQICLIVELMIQNMNWFLQNVWEGFVSFMELQWKLVDCSFFVLNDWLPMWCLFFYHYDKSWWGNSLKENFQIDDGKYEIFHFSKKSKKFKCVWFFQFNFEAGRVFDLLYISQTMKSIWVSIMMNFYRRKKSHDIP